MTQMVTLPPTWCSSKRKFRRKAVRDTSAQVGRVATRFGTSMPATEAIIASADRGLRLPAYHPGYGSPGAPQARRRALFTGKGEMNRNQGLHLDRLLIQVVGAIAPLHNRFQGRLSEHGMAAHDLEIFDLALAIDDRAQ
jgi:hypothetical protein